MFRPRTLQQRMLFFMLLPVAGLLLVMGVAVYLYAKESLLSQWKEAAILKLERVGREVDDRLDRPKNWMHLYHRTGGREDAGIVREWVIKRLDDLYEVERVVVTRLGNDGKVESASGDYECRIGGREEQCFIWSRHSSRSMMDSGGETMDFDRAQISEITCPRNDDQVGHETVSLTSELLDKEGRNVGRLEVVMRLKALIEDTFAAGWSDSEKVFLIGDTGRLLACSKGGEKDHGCLSLAIEVAQRTGNGERYGTIVRPAYARNDVIGFYRLSEAPWILVLIAPSEAVLQPMNTFRLFFFGISAGFFFIILVLIRIVAGRAVVLIQDVSDAAGKVARGQFETIPAVESRDEVGRLIESFNAMVMQLDERIRLKQAMDLAMQVQQSLLPVKAPCLDCLDIAGASVYCDETGGDYYDFISFPQWRAQRLVVTVGDVAGHGISAALFMTTARALLRSRLSQPGSLEEVVTDVNWLLCADTSPSGDFMSLFLLQADLPSGTMRWVRAGHAPALVYDWASDVFEELRGEGVVLGFDATMSFKEYEYTSWSETKALLIGTDGIWETENPDGEAFGMDRLRAVLRENARRSSKEIVEEVLASVDSFRQSRAQEDDVTLVVLKPRNHSGGATE